ncbi:ABC transporter C family member 10 [Linum perenne]
MEWEALWIMFCGASECSNGTGKECSSSMLVGILDPNSCPNHILVLSFDILIMLIIFCIFIYNNSSSARKLAADPISQSISKLLTLSAVCNSLLSMLYLGIGIWEVSRKLGRHDTVLPLHGWMVVLVHGFSLLLLNLSVSLNPKKSHFHMAVVKLCSVLAFCVSGFLCFISTWQAIGERVVSFKMILDILSFPGAVLMILCAFRGMIDPQNDQNDNFEALDRPLLGEDGNNLKRVMAPEMGCPFAKAGFFSKVSFWWLNSLMKKGKQKVLQDEDIPHLRKEEQATTCYLMYLDQLRKWKGKGSSDPPVLWSVILTCYKKEIWVSGFFALIKVLTLSAGPLLLRAFINVAERKSAFEYEGYVLTMALLLAKCIESITERQYQFQTRLVGVRVRSLLSAAIYRKQLVLSNAAKTTHSPGEIMNYVTTDAYKVGEFSYWFHQIWTTILQISLALFIIYYSVGMATIAALITIILTVIGASPLTKSQLTYQRRITKQQDRRLKAIAEALANMKVLKLYAWETHFRKMIEELRKEELGSISMVLFQRGCMMLLFWASPVLVSAVTFWTCYLLSIPLNASNVFTFLAALRIVQEPIRMVSDVISMFIDAKVSLDRIAKFLEAPELQQQHRSTRRKGNNWQVDVVVEFPIFIQSSEISWSTKTSSKATLRNINLAVKFGEKVAICGEVGSGKSTLLAAVLGEVPRINGTVNVHGKIAYVSQTAWIQTATIRDNILFGSVMEPVRYREVLKRCCLVKDLEMLPNGDCTEIGERGVNLSGGQKQRIQLARALYQDADVYLLDDPFSAVDAHTATSLFNEYVMGALSGKTVLLVTHQVDFLPAFNLILLMSSGEILHTGTYDQMLGSCQEFHELVNAHKNTNEKKMQQSFTEQTTDVSSIEIVQVDMRNNIAANSGDQLIMKEERETGDTGFKPYREYLNKKNGFLFCFLTALFHFLFLAGQLVQSYLLAADIGNPEVSQASLLMVYTVIGCILPIFMLFRSIALVKLGCDASESIFFTLLNSLFRAPMSFYDSTPLGRILSRVSSDLSIVDLELAFKLTVSMGSTMNTCTNLALLAILAWPVLFIIIPILYLIMVLQRYYFNTAKELMRINGTTKSSVASHLGESIAGAMTIRAFEEEDRFFAKNLEFIDNNASTYFHTFSASQWLIQRLEIPCAIVLSASALAMTLLPLGSSGSGFVGMALSYGLSLNVFLIISVQYQCFVQESIVSVERLEQYMHIPSEALEVMENSRPAANWPSHGKVEICNLKVRYQKNSPLVLKGISCSIEGGDKIGIVGRTGSGKTTLISSLFRLVEPTEGRIIVDGIDISTIGLHDLRSHFGIIPQDPTLFCGSVRYNLDPLSEHTDQEIWEVLKKCQLHEAIQQKEEGLSTQVAEDGTNWSMGQRQLFCLGRALLRKSKILVLDEATASIDNATDAILQRTIRTEFAECTVITVAHRIPTVMDSTKVLAISEGKLAEYDEPGKLMNEEGSLFRLLVEEYWSRRATN